MNKILDDENTYYQHVSGDIRDGNEWHEALNNGDISIKDFNNLDEVYWSSMNQAWLLL
jgi:hypothetical protein